MEGQPHGAGLLGGVPQQNPVVAEHEADLSVVGVRGGCGENGYH